MSVPMLKEWESPYQVVSMPGSISYPNPNATYVRDECWCGCTIFTPDT
jgi:hypothetical protein